MRQDNPTLGDIIARRVARRDLLKGLLATAATAAIAPPVFAGSEEIPVFNFDEIAHGIDETHHVAAGHRVDILLRWGDPIVAGAPEFDPLRQTAAAQSKQFGYNNDYVGFAPIDDNRGLLCVNHEYTAPEVMFPGIKQRQRAKDVNFAAMTRELVEIEMAAHGCSIVEIEKGADGRWSWVPGSRYNRRVTALDTEMRVGGPASGHKRLWSSADPAGNKIIGMVSNCAGGMTPWGTYLSGEENFDFYFEGMPPEGHPETANHKRYDLPGGMYAWGRYHDRFDLAKEPNEPNRFGWIVEIDPFDPAAAPVKRTALGRFKHEGAETALTRDGRVAVYSGDDERFEYVYKFVTEGRFEPADRAANRDLLDHGTLYAAKFNPDGSGEWLPLVHGAEALTAANGFNDQGDVAIEARRAADLLGATRMDRPEDIEPNPITGKVYVNLTNNALRQENSDKPGEPGPDPANPRARNIWGHIIEITNAGDDHAATRFVWDVLVRCGDPGDPAVQATWNPGTSENGWFACPDNMVIDRRGRLWVGTDQGSAWSKASGCADGVWALATEGPARGTGRMFFRAPVGAEVCGMRFLPGDTAMTIAVQHPGIDGVKDWKPFGRESTFDDPATRWPDFKDGMPPRPSVLIVTREDGGKIG
ncbi:MAG: PhoX family phosphatase [Alphaproteobacteria bacterium]